MTAPKRPSFRRVVAKAGAAAALAALAMVGAASLGAVSLTALSTPGLAQGRCGALWYERNEIYARNGYCFKTPRARAAFGAGCFPPYGRMSGWEKRRVDEIQAEEYEMGCPR